MLKKARLDDGGLDVETALIGPAVFLDVWAVRALSRGTTEVLRTRFTTALQSRNGSLLVSSPWLTELQTLQGDARTRATTFFSSLGAHWLLINPVVSDAAACEAKDELGAYLSSPALDGYIRQRCGELLDAGGDPHALTDDAFFDLGRTLMWTAEHSTYSETARAQSTAFKEAARQRALADSQEQRQDPQAYIRLYPNEPWVAGHMKCVHNAIWREITRLSPGRTWMANDGFDVAHLIPALTIGGLVSADTAWQAIGQAALSDLPTKHARLFRPTELEALVVALEAS